MMAWNTDPDMPTDPSAKIDTFKGNSTQGDASTLSSSKPEGDFESANIQKADNGYSLSIDRTNPAKAASSMRKNGELRDASMSDGYKPRQTFKTVHQTPKSLHAELGRHLGTK
jgi:hypothetical protein